MPYCCAADDTIVDGIIDKLSTPSSQVRLAAITALRHLTLNESRLHSVQNLLISAFETKSKIAYFMRKVIQTVFGVGALGVNSAERIQIVGTLFKLDGLTSKYMPDLLEQEGASGFYENRFDWMGLIHDLDGKVTRDILNKIILYSKDSASKDGGLICLSSLIDCNVDLSPDIKASIVALLFQTANEQSIRLLEKLDPQVNAGTEENKRLIEALSSNDLATASAAFDILSRNDLLYTI